MLEYLELTNTGPAPEMNIELAPRVNLFTGDNGLGKSFLLDVAWWALTRRWPREVNRRLTAGLPARPRDPRRPATIRLRVAAGTGPVEYEAKYSPSDEAWKGAPGRPWIPGLIVYAHADGSFSVWDPARNHWKRQGDADVQERRPAYVFTEAEVWDGLRDEVDGRPVPVCNGLLYDWSSWIKARDDNARAMKAILRALSPGQEDVIEPGPLVRLSIDDARDIPSIETNHAGPAPILHASSGVRRAVALAYMLTWTWSEHRLAAERQGRPTARRVIVLFDEVEGHLHPRWQRVILKALQDAGSTLLDDAEFQFLVSTHSPLVLASAEPWFDPDKDAWFDLDIKGDPPRACLQRRSYTPLGAVGSWLTSEAFDMATDRGSIEAEQAILDARKVLRQSDPPLDAVMEVHTRLGKVLPEIDRFWVRWSHFVESRGGNP